MLLFNGTDFTGWVARDGGPPKWKVRDGYMEVVPGAGDLRTAERLGNGKLKLEFWLPYMTDQTGIDRANSGVYFHGRYEVQILDSYDNVTFADGACGALYRIVAPLANACRPPETWQTLEVEFRAPTKLDAGKITARMNGVLILDSVSFDRPTGGGLEKEEGALSRDGRGPLLLQEHGGKVRFRHIEFFEDK